MQSDAHLELEVKGADMSTIHVDAKLAGFEERLTGVEKSVDEVARAIGTLSTEIRQSQKTQWPVIWQAMTVAISVLGLIGAMAYWPVRVEQARLQLEMDKQEAQIVPRREAELWRQFTKDIYDDHQRRLNRMEEYLFRLQK